jgi:alanyl-tRNA synthetase
MEALTGRGALAHFQSLDETSHALQQQFNARMEDIPAFVQSLQEKQKQLEKELKQLRMKLASGGSGREEAAIAKVGDVQFITRRVDDISGGDLFAAMHSQRA